MEAQRLMTILMADRPLTKTYKADGTSEPYPMVREFTSKIVAYNTIEEMLSILELTALNQGCILKGHLTRSIERESRASLGDTNATTDWIVLDYDADEGFASIEDLLERLDPDLCNVDYIFQHSASSGIKGKIGLRGHVFILLETPVAPAVLKQWIKKLNLTVPKLKTKIRLSKNAMALVYPLDITVNQNDKLIYVAPPTLMDGMVDPIKKRFELVKKENRTYTFGSTISLEENRSLENSWIADLQNTSGIPPRKPKYEVVGQEEILMNPAQCTVTSFKKGHPYTRLNLNGGDSWAYWHFTDNPEILYNYKGEPATYLKDVVPDYYNQLLEAEQRKGERPFVFRERKTDVYYNAIYDESTGTVPFCAQVSRRQSLADFMIQNGAPPPKVIPDWDMTFDPTMPSIIDFQNKKMNVFCPTKYMTATPDASKVNSFPTIRKVIRHICVQEDVYQHFLKWVAHILQFKTKTKTAWLFSTVEGTGKGLTFHKILAPLLGINQTTFIDNDALSGQFNGFVENNLLIFVDEGDVDSNSSAERVMGKLRTLITEDQVPVRRMRQNPYTADNHASVIIATNRTGIRLQASDRRWNVAPRQNVAIEITDDEIDVMIPSELDAFAQYLMSLEITKSDSFKVIQTQARSDLLELSKTVAEDFFTALQIGDLDYFAERLQDVPPIPDNGYSAYSNRVIRLMHDAIEKRPSDLTADDLILLYRYISGNESITPKRFAHLPARYGFHSEQRRVDGVQRKYYRVIFTDRGYELWLARRLQKKQPSLTNIPVLRVNS